MVLIISGRTTDVFEVTSQPKNGRQANVFGAFIGFHKAEVVLRSEPFQTCRRLIFIL